MEKFNKGQFEAHFVKALQAIAGAERTTKEELKTLSRTVLTAWHSTGSIDYINRLLPVLTPMHRRHMVTFAQQFSGYSFDKTLGLFTGKSKKRYTKALEKFNAAMEDPHFNVWTWFDKHKETLAPEQPDALDVDALLKSAGKSFSTALNKIRSVENGEYLLLKEILSKGIHYEAMVAIMSELEFEETKEPLPDAPM